jgi:hypothetical protein
MSFFLRYSAEMEMNHITIRHYKYTGIIVNCMWVWVWVYNVLPAQ